LILPRYKRLNLWEQSAPEQFKTIHDLVKFHPIRKSWDFNSEVLGKEGDGRRESAVIDIENVDVKDAGAEVEEIEEIGVENIGEDGDEDTSTWSSITVPSSPTFSVVNNRRSLPSTSDASEDSEFVEEVDGDTQEWSKLKRKRRNEPGEESRSRWKVARRVKAGMLSDSGSEVETDDDGKRSRSAIASRRLRESMRSGDFVVDERKRSRFEEKCIKMDRGAKFQYQGGSWQVLHSRCSEWYKMSEPYNTGKFKTHLGACKAKGNERNASITSFFKPRDPNDGAVAKPRITASGRNQIFIGGNTPISTSIKHPHTNNQLLAQTLPCRGISDIHNPLVSTYVSRTVVEGAGSITLQKATEKVYGKNIKYSELIDDQKAIVAITQSHLRSWSINRELQVVFSTSCTKFVEQGQKPMKTICTNCEAVARSDAFKRALRVKPVPVERMKFIPIKYRGLLEDLGAKFAGIRGLSELLQDVRSTVPSPVKANVEIYVRIHKLRCGCGLSAVSSTVNMMINSSSWP